MYCSNCGFKLGKKPQQYCPNCGVELLAHPGAPHRPKHKFSPLPQSHTPSVGRRIAVVIYVLAYLAVIAASVQVGLSVNQVVSAPDSQLSFVTCRDGAKVPYKLLGIRNPSTDPGHDNLLIDAACRNLGGNTYTNVLPKKPQTQPWQYALAAFAGGLIVIELVKGVLVYLVKGHFPGPGTLGRR
jgi:hypothetical protein